MIKNLYKNIENNEEVEGVENGITQLGLLATTLLVMITALAPFIIIGLCCLGCVGGSYYVYSKTCKESSHDAIDDSAPNDIELAGNFDTWGSDGE